MAGRKHVREQLQRNFVAIISLAVAVSSLAYNTWRNEASENNRNQRVIAIEVLRKLGELQELVFHAHYDRDRENRGNPRTGWALVLTVRDLSGVLEGEVSGSAQRLFEVWDGQWQALGNDEGAADAILAALSVVRNDVNTLLQRLD